MTLTAAKRATAVLNAHLRIHLNEEDAHLYPILRERTAEDEQTSIVGLMARKVPPDRTPQLLVRWLFPLLGHDDRAVVTRGMMSLMPPQVFAGLKPLIPRDDCRRLGPSSHGNVPERRLTQLRFDALLIATIHQGRFLRRLNVADELFYFIE